jgi:hypothetical protein
MNFLSGRNIFLIRVLDAFINEVWTGPEDSGKVREKTHFTAKGKEEILTETSEAKYRTRVFTKRKKRLVSIAREMFFITLSLFISNCCFSRQFGWCLNVSFLFQWLKRTSLIYSFVKKYRIYLKL